MKFFARRFYHFLHREMLSVRDKMMSTHACDFLTCFIERVETNIVQMHGRRIDDGVGGSKVHSVRF